MNWTLTYQWERLLGQDVLYSGPLFTHLFPHAWIDFRGVQDCFMRGKHSDYFENTRRSSRCSANTANATLTSRSVTAVTSGGISAGDGPTE